MASFHVADFTEVVFKTMAYRLSVGAQPFLFLVMSLSGSQISKSRPDPPFSLFFSRTFLVRMAQDFKRFEHGRPQCSVLPGSFFDNYLEQPALLRRRLLQEQLARPARQPHQCSNYIKGWIVRPGTRTYQESQAPTTSSKVI
jgi:hypothetical protein